MGDIELIGDWRRLQTSDHLYYMCTKWFTDGDVHAYFNPYDRRMMPFCTKRWRMQFVIFAGGLSAASVRRILDNDERWSALERRIARCT